MDIKNGQYIIVNRVQEEILAENITFTDLPIVMGEILSEEHNLVFVEDLEVYLRVGFTPDIEVSVRLDSVFIPSVTNYQLEEV